MSARRTGSNDSRRYYDWLSRAEADLRAADILKNCGGDNEMVAFHCQQSIEKALKGYLLFRTHRHFDGHSLVYLCRQACNFDKVFFEYLDESAVLNDFYISTRYPTDLPSDIDDNQVERIYRMAEDMFRVIKSGISSTEEEDGAESDGQSRAT